MTKVLIIHGFKCHGDCLWLPWLKKNLEDNGFEVFTPSLPNPSHPKLEEWLKALEDITKDFGEDDIIIGHSMGGKTALHLTENLKIKSLYLISTSSSVWKDYDAILKHWPNADIDSLRTFSYIPINFSKIESNTKKRFLFISKDDPFIPFKTKELFDETKWNVHIFEDKGHFQEETIPDVLSELLENELD